MDGSKGTKESEFEHDWMCDKKANVHVVMTCRRQVTRLGMTRICFPRLPERQQSVTSGGVFGFVAVVISIRHQRRSESKVFGNAKTLVTEASHYIQVSLF